MIVRPQQGADVDMGHMESDGGKIKDERGRGAALGSPALTAASKVADDDRAPPGGWLRPVSLR
jgi:hypothetical protein